MSLYKPRAYCQDFIIHHKEFHKESAFEYQLEFHTNPVFIGCLINWNIPFYINRIT